MAADSPLERRTGRPDRPGGRTPLRRKPKQLAGSPDLFEASSGAGGGLVRSRPRRPGHPDGPAERSTPPAPASAGAPDDEASLQEPGEDRAEVDSDAMRRARRIAQRLSVPRARRDVRARRGSGAPASVRYRGGSDEIDLDATLESLVAHPVPTEDDVVVREPMTTRRSVVLVVDVSGSMRGERALSAAAAVGALSAALGPDDLAVLAFWSDAALLVPLGRPTPPQEVLDRVLRLPSRGLTNVSFPLEVAARELGRVPARDARVLLLSDCVHNAGPDPRDAASRLARLDVLLDTSGEHDEVLGRELATVGRGRFALTRDYRDVGPALSRMFAS